METLDAIAARRSCRAYSDAPVLDGELETILRAGMAAPVGSAAYDTLHITVVENGQLMGRIFEEASDLALKMLGVRKSMDFGAPVLVLVSSEPARLPGMEYANAATVLENMCLAATGLGLDSLMWGAAAAAVAQSGELQEKLGIPGGFRPLLCASFGHAAAPEPAKVHSIAVDWVR